MKQLEEREKWRVAEGVAEEIQSAQGECRVAVCPGEARSDCPSCASRRQEEAVAAEEAGVEPCYVSQDVHLFHSNSCVKNLGHRSLQCCYVHRESVGTAAAGYFQI